MQVFIKNYKPPNLPYKSPYIFIGTLNLTSDG